MRRFKDSILKDKNFLREVVITIIVGIIINAFCFILSTITSEAANGVGENPYFPMLQNSLNVNDIGYREILSNNGVNFGDNYYFIMYNNQASDRISGYCLITDYEVTAEMNSDGLTFNMQNGRDFIGFYEFQIGINGSWIDLHSRDVNTLVGINFGNDTTWNYVCYCSNYQVDFYVYDFPCLLGPDNSINIGDFTDLPNIDEILNNIQNNWEPPSSLTGHALPSSPIENPNNTPFQERKEFFDYIADTITQNFGNLGYNLAKWFNGIQQKLTDGFNSVSQNIYNGFKTLMDNIKDFFGPKIDSIIEKFNYIIEEPDSEEIIDFIETTSVYSDISSINTSVTTFGSSFTSVSEPDDYTLTFHIEDIEILNQSDPFVLHLNILNPIKSTLRAFLWVIVSYGLFISVIDSLPNYINGGCGEDD